jgi:hypothetical protein
MTERSRFFSFSDSEEESVSSSSNAIDDAVPAAAAPIAALSADDMVIVVDDSSSDESSHDDDDNTIESAGGGTQNNAGRNASGLFDDTDDESIVDGIHDKTHSSDDWSSDNNAVDVAMANSESHVSSDASDGIEAMQGRMHRSMSYASAGVNNGFDDSSVSSGHSAEDSVWEYQSDPSWDDDNDDLDETYVPDQTEVAEDNEDSGGVEMFGNTVKVLVAPKKRGKTKHGRVAIEDRGIATDSEPKVIVATPEECEREVAFCCSQCYCPRKNGWFVTHDDGLYHRLCCHRLTKDSLKEEICTPFEACSAEVEDELTSNQELGDELEDGQELDDELSAGSIQQNDAAPCHVVHRRNLTALTDAAKKKAAESPGKFAGLVHAICFSPLVSDQFRLLVSVSTYVSNVSEDDTESSFNYALLLSAFEATPRKRSAVVLVSVTTSIVPRKSLLTLKFLSPGPLCRHWKWNRCFETCWNQNQAYHSC